MAKKTSFFGTSAIAPVLGFVLVLAVMFTGCATIFSQKSTTIKTASGDESGDVTIYERSKIDAVAGNKGASVYKGPLPARVPITIKAGQFVVEFTDKDGNAATKVIGATLNPFVILDAASLVGIIVDVVTGNIFSYHLANKKVPISYQTWGEIRSEAWIIEGIPSQMADQLVLVGYITDQ